MLTRQPKVATGNWQVLSAGVTRDLRGPAVRSSDLWSANDKQETVIGITPRVDTGGVCGLKGFILFRTNGGHEFLANDLRPV
jgi:hypothetical protein